MKISYNWLKQYIDITESAEEIGKILTATGLEVEHIETITKIEGGLGGIVIGEVRSCEPFVVKEKTLHLTTVDIGQSELSSIVCGASNVAAGQKVVVATLGATIYPTDGEAFSIAKRKVYGHPSEGMICAEDEIGLGASHAGIMVLDTDLPNGTPAADYFGLQPDYCIEIGLTPNRADAASHWGVARDLKAVLGRELKTPATDLFDSQSVNNQSFPITLAIENPAACPRFCGVTIDGVTVGPSPAWLQDSLKAIGLNPINNIVDITNYICHGLGQPMHAYDWEAITDQKIVVKNAVNGSKFLTLDKVERTLSDTDLMVCNATESMGIGGVFGGTKSGIKDDTTRIYLECAYFAPDSIRKTAMRHGLKTDASFRFERGTDPNAKLHALKYCAQLVLAVAGGVVASEVTDFYPNPIENHRVAISYRNIDRLIGKKIDKSLITKILNDLDIELLNVTESGFEASVPPYRVDVTREADVVEEVLRIYGFDNIELSPALSSEYFSAFPKVDADKQKLRIANILAANGFNETLSNSLTKPLYNDAVRANLGTDDVKILNYLSEDLSVMRQTMLFSGLEVLVHNLNRRQRDLKIFEFGKTYHKTDTKYKEVNHLALWLVGHVAAESWLQQDQKVSFQHMASAVHKVLAAFKIQNIDSQAITDTSVFVNGLTYMLNKKPLVSFGQVNPKLTKIVDIKQAVFYADFDWSFLLKQYSELIKFSEIPKFPEVRRDLSLVLEKAVTYQQIQQVARKYEKELLRSMNVFDVYDGDKIEAGKKSYSVSFILQDTTQTLTDKVIDKTMQKLMLGFEKELGAVIRK